MSINVETHTEFLTTLYVKLRDAVCTKHAENAFLGELVVRLDDVILRLPCVTRSL